MTSYISTTAQYLFELIPHARLPDYMNWTQQQLILAAPCLTLLAVWWIGGTFILKIWWKWIVGVDFHSVRVHNWLSSISVNGVSHDSTSADGGRDGGRGGLMWSIDSVLISLNLFSSSTKSLNGSLNGSYDKSKSWIDIKLTGVYCSLPPSSTTTTTTSTTESKNKSPSDHVLNGPSKTGVDVKLLRIIEALEEWGISSCLLDSPGPPASSHQPHSFHSSPPYPSSLDNDIDEFINKLNHRLHLRNSKTGGLSFMYLLFVWPIIAILRSLFIRLVLSRLISASVDGVVVKFDIFGSGGTNSSGSCEEVRVCFDRVSVQSEYYITAATSSTTSSNNKRKSDNRSSGGTLKKSSTSGSPSKTPATAPQSERDTAEGHHPSFLGLVSQIVTSPRKMSDTLFYTLNRSQSSVSLSLNVSGITVTAQSSANETNVNGDYGDTNTSNMILMECKGNVLVKLEAWLSRLSGYAMSPTLSITGDSIIVNADSVLSALRTLKRSTEYDEVDDIFVSPILNASEGDIESVDVSANEPPRQFNKEMERAKSLLMRLCFWNSWKSTFKFKNVQLNYRLSSKAEIEAFTRYFGFDLTDGMMSTGLSLNIAGLALGLECMPHNLQFADAQQRTDVPLLSDDGIINLPNGSLRFHFRLHNLKSTFKAGPSVAALYEQSGPVGVDLVELKSVIPFALLGQLLVDQRVIDTSYSDNRLLDVDLSINGVSLVIDLHIMTALLHALAIHYGHRYEMSMATLQKPARRRLGADDTQKWSLIQFYLSRYAYDLKFLLAKTLVVVIAPGSKDPKVMHAISVDLKTVVAEMHWDRHDKSSNKDRRLSINLNRRPSLAAPVYTSAQLYLSFTFGLSELNVRLHSAAAEKLGKIVNDTKYRCKLPACIHHGKSSIIISSTIPGIVLMNDLFVSAAVMGSSTNSPTDSGSPLTTAKIAEVYSSLEIAVSDTDCILCPIYGLLISFAESFSRQFEEVGGALVKYQSPKTKANNTQSSLLSSFEFIFDTSIELRNVKVIGGGDSYGKLLACFLLDELDGSHVIRIGSQNQLLKIQDMEGKAIAKNLQYAFISKDDICDRHTILRVNKIEALLDSDPENQNQGNDAFNVSLSIDAITGVYGLFPHLLFWYAKQYLSKVAENFKILRRAGNKISIRDLASTRRTRLQISYKVSIEKVDVKFELPNSSSLYFDFQSINITVLPKENQIVAIIDRSAILTDKRSDLLRLDYISLVAKLKVVSTAEQEVVITLGDLLWYLPENYNFAHLLDNIANFIKAMKQLHGNNITACSDRPAVESNDMRRSQFQLFPTIYLNVKKFQIIFEDDSLDASLSRIHVLGLEEQKRRLDRLSAMNAKFEQLRREIQDHRGAGIPQFRQNLILPDRMLHAYDMLDSVNSEMWVKLIKNCRHNFEDEKPHQALSFAPLFHIVANNLVLTLSKPRLTALSLEEMIHQIDPVIPVASVYDVLVGLHADLKLSGFSMRVRDFTDPMLNIPASGVTHISGGLIVAERVLDIVQQSRRVSFAISEMDRAANVVDVVSVFRTIIPPMIFTNLKIKLPNSYDLTKSSPIVSQFVYGIGHEPHLADLNRIFAGLTPASVDPSESLSFWDKLRMTIHGSVSLSIPNGGSFCIRLTGSRIAHDQNVGPNAGLDIILKDGVELQIGQSYNETDVNTKKQNDNQADYEQPPIQIVCGQVQVSVPRGDYDEIMTRLSGGLKLGLRLDFETEGIVKSHAEIFTRAPLFAISPNGGKVYDSFAGFRSKSIVVNFFAAAPAPDFIHRNGKNMLQLSHELIEHLTKFSKLYGSILTVLPIKRGPIHNPPPKKPPTNQKLSRYIRGVNIQAHMEKLLVGYNHHHFSYTIGLRAKMDDVSLALCLQQENFIPGKRGANFKVVGADFDLVQLNVRAVSRGDFTVSDEAQDDDCDKENMDAGSSQNELSLVLSDDQNKDMMEGSSSFDWVFDEDFYEEDFYEENEVLYNFLEAVKVIYYRHGSNIAAEILDPLSGESKLPERDVSIMQIGLLQKRLQEIESEIQRDKDTIKNWENRISLFQDELLELQSQELIKNMEVLYEKKATIKRHIENRKKRIKQTGDSRNGKAPHLRNLSVSLSVPPLSGNNPRLSNAGHFRKDSILSLRSNVNNSQVKRHEYLHRYFVHNLSVLWSVPIRNLVYKFFDLETTSTSMGYYMKHHAIRILKQLLSDAAKQPEKSNAPHEKLKPHKTAASADGNENLTKAASDLLEHLLNDRNENFVISSDNPTSGGEGDNPDDAISKDPSHPSYVSPEFSIYHDVLIQCFYPQLNFQTPGIAGNDGALIVAAESANLKTSLIVDETSGEKRLVKTRRTIVLEKTQVYSVFKDDVYHKLGKQGLVKIIDEIAWPVWVKVENLIDNSLTSEEFSKFVIDSQVKIQLDRVSPLYIRGENGNISKNSSLNPELYELEVVNCTHVEFPTLLVRANSKQYCAIHDVIGNLISYDDPMRKKRNEQIRTVLFALIKEDLTSTVEMLIKMQDRIRRYNQSVQYGISKSWDANTIDDEAMWLREENRQNVELAMQELLIYIDAVQRISSQRQSQASVKKSHRTIIHSEQVSWKLMQDNNETLGEFSFYGANYNTLSYEDRSNMHTIEIDKLHMVNQLPNPYYVDLIAPYLPDERDLDFNRHKMLRVYWREMPPVAGIPIIDHFEINIFPLLFQLTYDAYKHLIDYLYPKKKELVNVPHTTSLTKTPRPNTAASNGATLTLRNRASTMSSMNSMVSRTQSFMSETGRRQSTSSNDMLDLQSSVDDSPKSLPLSELTTGSSKKSKKSKRMRLKKIIPLLGKSRTIPNIDVSDDSEAQLMKDRASNNKTFIYIKVPGSTHCLSYHGEREKNIEDMYRFVLKLPTLEYHNRTWSWLEFMIAIRKDIAMAVFSQTGSLMREKLMMRKRPKKRPPKQGEDFTTDQTDTEADAEDDNSDSEHQPSGNGKHLQDIPEVKIEMLKE